MYLLFLSILILIVWLFFRIEYDFSLVRLNSRFRSQQNSAALCALFEMAGISLKQQQLLGSCDLIH